MTDLEIRAQQKLVQAFRQIVGAVDSIRTHLATLKPDPVSKEVADEHSFWEVVKIEAQNRITVLQDDGPPVDLLAPIYRNVPPAPEVPPEGPGIEEAPQGPVLIA